MYKPANFSSSKFTVMYANSYVTVSHAYNVDTGYYATRWDYAIGSSRILIQDSDDKPVIELEL